MRSSASVGYRLRPFLATDLPAALELQQVSYPESLRDALEAFASRLDVGPEPGGAAGGGGRPRGYILAPPWPPASPPAVDTVIEPPAGSQVPAAPTGAVSAHGLP